ncbi:galactosylceramide sulfotransferase-like [Glandiceps talaboti]
MKIIQQDGNPRLEQDKKTGDKSIPLDTACQRKDDIAFFKMHKCSSSTIQNMLFRYGEKHDLTFVMPPNGNHLGHGTYPFNKKFMIQVPWNLYNIYTFHSIFSYKGISEVMPKDTVYVTAIRDPVTMYESTFTYLGFGARYGLKGPDALKKFLGNADTYYKSNNNKGRVKNPMLYDLGTDVNDMYNMPKLEARIKELGNIFDFVIITEYFDESLILLREMMCWELDDVVSFKLNARSSSSVYAVSPDMAVKIKNFNAGDVKLYNYFNESFFKKLDDFGKDRMKEEVAKLRERNMELQDMCVDSLLETSNRVHRPPGMNIEDFRLKPGMDQNPICKGMTLPELMYTDKVRKKLLAKIRDYTAKHARPR